MIERYTLPKMRNIWTDKNRFNKWLHVEILACEALAEKGKIPLSALKDIKQRAVFNIKRINDIERVLHHDTAAFVSCVQESVGPNGRYIHRGLTSSDVVDTALSLMMKEATGILLGDIDKLLKEISKKAKKYKYTPMIGRTHGVHAEPTTLGCKFALMLEEFRRAKERLQRAREIISYGKLSGAVGTYAHLNPTIEEYVCKHLGLKPEPISTQVIQRDRHAEFISILALVGSSLERWAQEIRSLQRTEVRELEEPFRKGQRGSSAMPHKRNPVICERICGLARLLRGYAVTAAQNVALWHERDISHSSTERVIVPDATITLDYILNKMTEVIKDLNVYPENMKKNLELTNGLIFSQRVLLILIDKGITRDKAYKIVQDNAMKTWAGKGKFKELLLKDKRVTDNLKKKEIAGCFEIKYFFKHVNTIFNRLGL